MAIRIQLRHDTASNWATNNPILYPGEFGVELDTGKIKVGPEVESPAVGTAWNSISTYLNLVPADFDSIINGYLEVTDIGAIGGVAGLNNSKNLIVPGESIIIEGSTDNAFETTLVATDPTADRTITLPDATTTLVGTNVEQTLTNKTLTSPVITTPSITGLYLGDGSLVFEGATADSYETTLAVEEPTADNTLTLPDATGTIATEGYVDDAIAAFDSLPLQTGNDGKFLQTTGSTTQWATVDLSTKQDKVTGVSDTEIGYLDGVTSSIQDQLDSKSTASKIESLTNKTLTSPKINENVALTATATELNTLDGITASTSELNILDGATLTTTELNYVDGVTSAIQDQLDAKFNTSDASTTNISEGTRLYFTDERARDAAAALITDSTHTGISVAYTDSGSAEGSLAFTNTGVTSLTGTANEVVVSSSTGGVTVGLPDDVTIGNNLVVYGNLNVQGTTTTSYSSTVSTKDNLLYLNAAYDATVTNAVGDGTYVTYTADNDFTPGMDVRVTGMNPTSFNIATSDLLTVYSATATQFVVAKTTTDSFVSGGTAHAKSEVNADLGFAGGYYDGSYAHAGLFRDASDGKFKVFQGYTLEPDEAVNIDTTHGSFALAPIAASSIEVTSATIGDVSNTEIGYLNGVTSGIQAQIDDKQDILIPGTGLDVTGANINIDNAELSNYLLEGASGNSYGLIGTSTYLDVKNTNGYNKEIELDIAAVESKLNTDGYVTESSTSTLTNKTITSPIFNQGVQLTATSTELNILDGVTVTASDINQLGDLIGPLQEQLDGKSPLAGGMDIVTVGTISTGTWEGTKIAADKGGTGNTSYSLGDILYASGTSTLSPLAIGTPGYLLTATTSGPEWAAAPVSLPDQTGNNGEFLTTDGTTASWVAISNASPSTAGLVLGLTSTSSENTALGHGPLTNLTTGTYNTAVGKNALLALTSGNANTALGLGSLKANTSGSDNTALGLEALWSNVNGSSNVAVGRNAMQLNSSGGGNVVIGYQSLYRNTSGNNNTVVGKQAAGYITGSENTILGAIAAYTGSNDITSGSNNIVIGYSASASSAGISNEITLGNSSITRFRIPGINLDFGKTATITANTATAVDSTALSAFTSIEYMVSIKQGSKIRTSKVIVQTDGTSVDMTEFAITETGGTISGVAVSAAVSSTNGVLQVTVTDATSTNATVKLSKVTL